MRGVTGKLPPQAHLPHAPPFRVAYLRGDLVGAARRLPPVGWTKRYPYVHPSCPRGRIGQRGTCGLIP